MGLTPFTYWRFRAQLFQASWASNRSVSCSSTNPSIQGDETRVLLKDGTWYSSLGTQAMKLTVAHQASFHDMHTECCLVWANARKVREVEVVTAAGFWWEWGWK